MTKAVTLGLLTAIVFTLAMISFRLGEIRHLAYVECLDRMYPHGGICD